MYESRKKKKINKQCKIIELLKSTIIKYRCGVIVEIECVSKTK
jgi:hypothetical protein